MGCGDGGRAGAGAHDHIRGLEGLLTALADFADLKSPWLRGHSREVAAVAEEAAALAGLDDAERVALRRAALVHDVGRVGVPNGIWDKPGPLTSAEGERVRLHPHLTSRILQRCTPLAVLAGTASAHHERVDGGGYHSGLPAEAVSLPSRILAAADVFAALVAHRPTDPPTAGPRRSRSCGRWSAGSWTVKPWRASPPPQGRGRPRRQPGRQV
ncbi:MAG TPA: HD domain-containing phosphohydrolase [Euzebya sp.]|nr:HD domain-containing phosphohydrolase [Euzebya sp.]